MVASAHVAAIVCEEMPAAYEKGITYIRVADSAEALGRLASAWHGHPSRKLKLVGVTGTNGKTTTATLLYEMAKFEGFKAALSTVCNYVVNRAVPTTHTTPDPLTLNSLLAQMVEEGCEYAFMEVSSHSTAQKRVAGLNFAGGIFTNLTRDHLDYHGTVENYMKAKKAFFDMLPADAFALTNADDKCGMYMVQNTKAKVYTYSLRSSADFKGRCLRHASAALSCSSTAARWRCSSPDASTHITSPMSTEASILSGFDPEEVIVNMSRPQCLWQGVSSRSCRPTELRQSLTMPTLPHALVNVLDTIREIVGRKAR